MEAPPSRLHALLEELHAELARHSPAVDARDHALLASLRADLARYQAAGSPEGTAPPAAVAPPETDTTDTEHPRQLRPRLQEWIVRLEGSHPQFAATLEQAATALSNMGL